ncbi:hypothetical protein [Paraburkholderia sp. JHI869]|uniref:hypothetical protein n=1 Tax=Paraburkholderia sp. JHI869 TaxID=3112959 RepID=UPI00316C1AF0
MKIKMKKITTMWAGAVVLTASAAMQSASAHTQEWYSSHLPEARAMESQCLARLKTNGRLSQDDMDECHRASGAVVHSAKFTPSDPKTY